MYSIRPLLFILAFFFVFASAAPVKRRGTCPRKNASASAAPSATSTPVASASVTPKVAAKVSASSSAQESATASSVKSSSTASSASPSASGKSSNKATGALAALFPVSDNSKSWTTSAQSDSSVSLSDATLRPTKVLSALSHDYVNFADKKAMKAHYPKGSYNFQHEPLGGFSFYAPGPDNVDLTTAREATFGYSVYFPEGFQFNLGGKLPGLYGGDSEEESVSCSGGRRSTACFSARLMWRTEGQGEFYTYLPPYTESGFEANKKQCSIENSDCNPTYGTSIARGSFTFPTGEWTTVSERVRLNTPGKADGSLELFVNGKSMINVDGLILRDSEAGRIRGIQAQTFFGGSKAEWASPKDQDAYFADFSVAITEKL